MRFIALVILSAFLPFGLTMFALDAFSPAVSANFESGGRVLGVTERQTAAEVLDIPASPEKLPDSTPVIHSAERTAGFLEYGELSSRAIVVDAADSQVLFESAPDEVRPIASLTKLASALAFLSQNPDLESEYTIAPSDLINGARLYLMSGDRVKKGDLLQLALVASANEAAQALAGASGLTVEDFVDAMNRIAARLNLSNTNFVDPTGIGAGNVSTAREVALLAKAAIERPEIREAMALPAIEFQTFAGRVIKAISTDSLLKRYPENGMALIGGKTGYTKAAGYCFAARFSRQGQDLIVAVLGEDAPNGRFETAERLMQWAYANYEWE